MRSVQLTKEHRLEAFNCGVDDLSLWLRNHAVHAQRAGTANTFVWSNDGEVVAYYSLAAHQVQREMLPTKEQRGTPETIPAYIIGKLALDASLRGRKLGPVLLWDAFERCVHSSRTGPAAKLIVVDAIDASKNFYAEHMIGVPNDPNRFYLKVSTAEKVFRSRPE